MKLQANLRVFLLVALAAGCGNDKDPDKSASPSDAAASPTKDSGTDESADADPDGGAPPVDTAPDTTPPIETVPTAFKISNVSSFNTCSEVCTDKETDCAEGCEDIGRGKASYGYYDWDYGWTTIVTSVPFETCDDSAEGEAVYEGETYELAHVWCCCGLPKVKIVKGDMSNVRSCTEICAEQGLECYEHHAWSSDKVGGVKMWYQRPSTGGSAYLHGGCEGAPKPKVKYANAERILMGYDCACY